MLEDSITDSEGLSGEISVRLSSDSEEEARVDAGADLRRGVNFDFVDLPAAGPGGLKAGRPRFAGGLEDVVGIIRSRKVTRTPCYQ